MNAEESLKLARRFIELPLEKRRLFLEGVREEGIDFSLLPIPAQVLSERRDLLSYAQRRMWFLWQLDPQSGAYNLPMAVRLHGELNQPALQQAFDALVTRHESLRTRFRQEGEEIRQQVLEPFPIAIQIDDLTTLSPIEREEQIKAQAEAQATAPFDLAEGPLLRVRLLRLGQQEHALLFTLHHIVADGWSLNLLIEEFLRLYDAACDGATAELSALPIQYRDYALWQRSWLEAGERERQLGYWQNKLGDDHTPLALPTDHPHPARPSHRGARHALQIDSSLTERLQRLARQHNVTLFMVLLAAFQLLLQRYSGQSAIRVGVPIANRQRAEVEGLIGCFINTQVLHTEIDPLSNVADLLQRVRETALGAQAHQELPFEQLVEALDLERSTAYTPLFQVLFNHQPSVADVGELKTRSGLTLTRIEPARVTARFDLTLDTWESAGRLHAAFTYAQDLFEESSIVELGRNWLQLLDGLTAQNTGAVGELPLDPTSPAAPAADLVELPVSGIHQLIEQAASQHPERLAATSGDDAISYARLNARADALARVLLAAGIQPDQRVGVVGDRSIDMLVGILGALKAGAAYLPLEPEQPQERLEFMLLDSSVTLVIGRSSWGRELPAGIRRIDLDQPLPDIAADTATPVQVAHDNLAYVIYTSGTTGTPKGVAVSHGALVNYVNGMARRLPLDCLQNLAMVSTPAADLGHTMLYGALCAGKTLHLLDRETGLDAEAFAARLQGHAVDALKIVPSHLEAMLAAGRAALPRHCLILGGEACPPELLARIASLDPDLRVFNHYGPTETTVGALTGELTGLPLLGSPLDNVGIQVLDSCLQPVPGTARGELHISGMGLARGYLERPALTAECFIPDPAGSPGSRMYRTGDLVRRHGNDQLLFAGRMDGQVKIRGYRVELAEIESCLRQLPQISNALVRVAGEGQARQLVGYLVPTMTLDEQAQQALLDGVRTALKQALPEHMVPTCLLVLERLPVTANGKVDLKALPEPVASSAAYVAPNTPLQEQLAGIWAEVLQVERVGLTDNFFALGGHSLLATQVVSRARKQLGFDIPLRSLFDTADLQGFARVVEASDRELDAEIERVDRDLPLAVSHAQHRQWLFWKLNPQSTAYNTPLAVRMQGRLDRQALQDALNALVTRHESLRTVFQEDNGLPWQRILPVSTVTIGYEDLTGQDEQLLSRKLEEEAFTPFDLEQGPLIRASLFKTREDEHLLAVTLHHIVSDGWSMSVMVREFAAAYNAGAAGQIQELQPLPVQYADYAAWQRQRLASGQMQAQLAYWQARLENDFDVLELPADRPRPQVQSYRGGRVDIRLPSELTASLRRLAVEANATLFHVFLAAFAILLSRYSGRDKINIGVPITNRNRLELEGLIGFFVNTIVARIAVDPVISFAQLLDTVKETTLEAQANKDIPFDVLVEELRPERGLGHNPLFQVMYNHLRDVGEQVSADSLRGLRVEEVELSERNAQFDIALSTLERTDGVIASFNYSSDLFEKARIERLAKHWISMLEGIVNMPNQHNGELQMLSGEERQQLVCDWNRTEASYPSGQCIHQLIEAQTEKTPDAVAVVFGAQELTYHELNRRSNQLAHKLRELGVAPDVLIGIAVERSLEMVIGLLAILKAGGAYVPLDPEYPQDRLAYMMENSQALLLLSQSALLDRLPGELQANIQLLDQLELESYPTENPAVLLSPDNLAYSIYTSGSTGRPKGVLIEHRNVAALIGWAHSVYSQEDLQGVLASTSICFDLSVWELFVTLAAGGYVVLASNALELPHLAAKGRVRLINTVPSAIKVLHESGQIPDSVRIINLAGEALKQSLVDSLYQADHIEKVYDLYGPSEDTTYSTYTLRVPEGQANIGVPISNSSAYLLSGSMTPQPIGCAGEIGLAGAGVVRGYLGRPALTAEKFLPNPFDSSEQGGGRLYRTGDLARYHSDGVIEYVGRIDHQVKIRGFRIELGEIEARLQGHDAVREAVVIDIDGSNGKQLVSYLVTDTDLSNDPEQQAALRIVLRDHLKETLPDYMVPAHLVFLEQLPLTPNGKLDRKALPTPDVSQLQKEYVVPQSDLEQQVAAIWADVLKVEKVGLTDHFFELGGHSLLATQVISRIRQALDIELPLRTLFETPVLAEFAAQTGQGMSSTAPAFERVDRAQPLALSYAQQRQWFLWQLEPVSAAYNMPAALRLKGELDIEALRSSFEALIARHETLRTTFRQDGEQTLQIIHPQIGFVLDQEALEKRDGALIQSRVEEEIAKPFDLEHGPLLRVKLLCLAEDDHVLVLTLHHIVSDGWSMPIMVDELTQLYEGYRTGQPATLPELPIQYADYAIWQRNWMEAGEQERQLAYWKEQLGDEQPVLELPADHPRPARQSQQGAGLSIELNDELAQSLKQLAQQQGVTLFMLLLASFQTLLHRYSGQNDIRVGVPIANRNRVETERLIGFFVNTQVLKAEFDLHTTFSDLLNQVQQTALGAQAHQDLPFEQLVEALQPERSLSHSPLFQVMFNYQSQVKGETRQLPGLEVAGLAREETTTKFDLSLDTFEHEQGIGASLSYATTLFDRSTIERLAGHWVNLLQSIVKAPEQRIAELSLLSKQERQQIVYDWNRTDEFYSSDQRTHQVIEGQAEKAPDTIALILGDQQLTYQQLNQQANQLAHKLRELGVGPDVLVGIAVERSLDMVVGLLAILKAGGAYVPLDPEYPQERLAYMMEDSGIRLLLTQSHLQDRLPSLEGIQRLAFDQNSDWLDGYSEANLDGVTQPESLAYVMYTSGSTGKPKGVAISHEALSVFCAVACEYSRLSCADRVLQFATVSFDGFVEQLYPALCVGAQVVLRDTQLWDSATLYANIRKYGITLADLPAAYWRLMAMDEASGIPCESLRQVHVGGEALPLDGLKAWLESKMAGVRLLNTYGPTEATVVATVYDCSPISPDRIPVIGVPIGHVLPGRTVHITDYGLAPAPAGVAGELCIGGSGCLARGYFNRPALTAERFIPDPFDISEQGGGRLYRTGDLACYRNDGVIDYAGRIDHQVKIRGFRIELGEIEAKLQEHAAIRDTLVVDIDGPSGKQLAAYLVTEVEPEQQAELRTALRDHLKASLPDYMVPTHLIFLESMPLSPNGKLDRKALPKPDASQLQREYVAPQSELAQQIAAIWADVLKVEKVGLTDNFFELGGHSLLATQVISRIRQTLNIEMPLRTLFETPVLAEFAAQTGQGTYSTAPAFERVDRDQPLALSYAQQRQWFLWQLEPESAAYNMPAALRLKGELDIEALRLSFQSLTARHETLRTTFHQDGEYAIQVIHPQIDFALGLETPETTDEALIQVIVEGEVARPFNLEHGPLLRVKLLRLAEYDHVLVLTMHHIVSDGWSMPIMVDELIQLYEGYRTGQPATLPKLPIQYADYAIWQRNWMEAGEQERQLAYWKEQLGDEQPVLELPTDRARPALQSQQGAGLSIELDDQLAQSLKQLAQQQGVTLFMLLLASFQTLLHRYSGQNDIRVGVPIANRNRVETERLIGFFVNTQVLKAEFDLHTTFSELLKQVQQTALGAQAHQDLPFEQLVEALQPERSLSHSPLFQVMYNHQSQVKGASRQLPELEVAGLVREETTTKFDLSLDTFEHEQGIGASLSYATALFDQSTIERLAGHWLNLLQGIVKVPQQRIAELPMLSDNECRTILAHWDNTDADCPSDRYIHQLIEDQARRTPEAVAVIFNDQPMTYRELDAQANRLAHKLIELGVQPEVRVAIAMPRTAETVVAFLAVLKAGGAYVPMDVAHPPERLLFMMEDCSAALLLTHSDLLGVLTVPQGMATVLLDQVDTWSSYPSNAPAVAITESNLAYVIYTSGSTGQPKGVAVAHGPLVAHMRAIGELYETNPADCELHFMSFAFDGSHEGWMPPLIKGARILIRDDSLWLPEHTYAQMHRHGVTIGIFPPVYLQQLAEHAAREGNPPPTRIYCFGGDAVPQASYDLAWKALRPQHIVNGYGPTETVVTPLLWKAGKGEPCGAAYAPIGTLVGRRHGYILDSDLGLLPTGFAGELYLGGHGIARGYLNRPSLTAERFVPDPFGNGERVYRSGDLTRARVDGVVDYLGRIDYQVKIRGFRIELGEIESRLQRHDAVSEAVVIDIDGPSGKQLVAYLVADAEQEQQADLRTSLRDHLKEALPDYMVPTHLVFLDAMPLTPNGKLDRKALPIPDVSQLQQEYVAPQSDLEKQIAATWADVLKVEKIGLNDNFFELGGHSLLVTQAVVRLQKQIGVDVTLREVFEYPRLVDFSRVLANKSSQKEPLQAELTKSLEALKRLTSEEIDELTS